jgi:hypothetical protein
MPFERDTSVQDFWDKLLPWWGMLFRFSFILCLGIVAWVWLNQPGITEVPIGQLTLKQIASQLFAGLSAAGCVFWFFSFPNKDEGLSNSDWGKLGAWIVGGALLAWVALNGAPW